MQVAYPTSHFKEVKLDIKRISDVAKNSRGPRATPPTWPQWARDKLVQKLGTVQTAVADLLGMGREKLVLSEWQMARNRYNRMVRACVHDHTAAAAAAAEDVGAVAVAAACVTSFAITLHLFVCGWPPSPTNCV